MSEPFWVGLGGIPVDWAGDWSALTQYQPGDVVTYLGVYYLAVNPSLASAPGPAFAPPLIGLSLPLAPVDGQQFILTDSLTAPTYAWQLVYMAGKASNKWVFVGGSPLTQTILTEEVTASATYADLTTVGPSLTLPVAGDYWVTIGCYMTATTDNAHYAMSFAAGATAASDAWSVFHRLGNATTQGGGGSRRSLFTGRSAGELFRAKYRAQTGSGRFQWRSMEIVPVAVGG